LTELYLNHTNLTSLLPEIGQLTNLTELYLWDNQLSDDEIEAISRKLPNCQVVTSPDYDIPF
jgi:Leucine-rich repeat (LRR) protein